MFRPGLNFISRLGPGIGSRIGVDSAYQGGSTQGSNYFSRRWGVQLLADVRGRTRNPKIGQDVVDLNHVTLSLGVPNLLKTWSSDKEVSISENVMLKVLMRGGDMAGARRIIRDCYAYLKRKTGDDPSLILHYALLSVAPIVMSRTRSASSRGGSKSTFRKSVHLRPLEKWQSLRHGARAIMSVVPPFTLRNKLPPIHIRLANELLLILERKSKALEVKKRHHQIAYDNRGSIVYPQIKDQVIGRLINPASKRQDSEESTQGKSKKRSPMELAISRYM